MKRFLHFLGIFFALCMLPSISASAETKTMYIRGFIPSDEVYVYRIAYRSESGDYLWESQVVDWLETDGTNYENLTPVGLANTMVAERSQEFCELLLMGLRNETTGTVNLPKIKLTGQTYYEEDLEQGFYIILPKGDKRVYSLKWVALKNATLNVIYGAEDYSLPEFEYTIENKTTDRGIDEDGRLWMAADDETQISLTIGIPDYPAYYTNGKLISAISVQVPSGLILTDSSLVLKGVLGGVTDTLTLGSDYSIQNIQHTNAYYLTADAPYFYGTDNSWFYEPDGGMLINGTVTDAVATVNDLNDVSYTEENFEVHSDIHLLVLSVDTDIEYDELQISLCVTKDDTANDDCMYEVNVGYMYSTSAIDPNERAGSYNLFEIASLGVKVTVLAGDGFNSYDISTLMAEADRLPGAIIQLCRLIDVYDISSSDYRLNQALSNLELGTYYVTYNNEGTEAYLYGQIGTLTTDDNGEASYGGLPRADYLLREIQFPEGYMLSRESFIIDYDDWENSAIMEGNYLCDTLWLDYEGAELPDTGGVGTYYFTIIGILLMLLVLILLIIKTKKKKDDEEE